MRTQALGEGLTRLHFWVWKHDMVLVPRSGSSLVNARLFRAGKMSKLRSRAVSFVRV